MRGVTSACNRLRLRHDGVRGPGPTSLPQLRASVDFSGEHLGMSIKLKVASAERRTLISLLARGLATFSPFTNGGRLSWPLIAVRFRRKL